MHKGSEDNLRASPVRAVQAMMASRLKNLLPPMTVKRERLSWYKAIPLSSDPQFEACLIDCDSQTGILWYRTSKERLCGWKVAIWPRRNTISHRFKSEGYLIITVSTRKIPYKLIVSHCHGTLIVSTESLAFRIAFRDVDKRRYYFTCLLLNSSFLPMSRNIINFSFFIIFFSFTHTEKNIDQFIMPNLDSIRFIRIRYKLLKTWGPRLTNSPYKEMYLRPGNPCL